jgi:GT2 family glycosyltransferase
VGTKGRDQENNQRYFDRDKLNSEAMLLFASKKHELNMDKVYILILNWNGWLDTIECLESVFRTDHPNYQVLVCDNGSPDGSLTQIKAWAEGKLAAPVSDVEQLRALTSAPVPKPLSYVEYDRLQAEAGGQKTDDGARLILIKTGANLGFAGGNNVGLRYALAKSDYEYIWLLNNDTVVKHDALSQLVQRMKKRPDAGICGSTLPYYRQPNTIWAYGGATYNKWIAKPRHIGLNEPFRSDIDVTNIEKRLYYIAGASMLVSRSFLHDIGLCRKTIFLFRGTRLGCHGPRLVLDGIRFKVLYIIKWEQVLVFMFPNKTPVWQITSCLEIQFFLHIDIILMYCPLS